MTCRKCTVAGYLREEGDAPATVALARAWHCGSCPCCPEKRQRRLLLALRKMARTRPLLVQGMP